ncbi:MAG: S-layer homology domain-containing protein, partial [Symploca sp. SIO2D2]|nr:S-layer homology domain-containing protein [Symploca sp. SIO2D2]
ANIRRLLGYTTLFQPKKAVTRAETAAVLWYIGYQGEGISAKEVQKLNSSQEEEQEQE